MAEVQSPFHARIADSPVPAPADTATVALAAGSMHTCAKLLSGSLVCWGDNNYGQLGTGDTTMRLGATGVSVGGGACHFSWYVFWNRCSSLFGELAAAASPLSLGGHVRHKHWKGMERPLRLPDACVCSEPSSFYSRGATRLESNICC